jgi:hypothetical protein
MKYTDNVMSYTNPFGNDPLNIIGKTFECSLYKAYPDLMSAYGYKELGMVLGTWDKYPNDKSAYTVALEGGEVIVLDKVNIVGFGYKP